VVRTSSLGPGSTASGGRRQLRRASRERELLDATLTLLAEDGAGSFTLQRLADRVDAAVGAIYRYFPSKEALLAALQAQVLGDLHRQLLAGLEAASTDPAAPRTGPSCFLRPLLWAARWYADLPAREPQRFHLLATAVGDPRPLVPLEQAALVLGAATPLFAQLEQRLAAATDAGALADGDHRQRAVMLWAALQGVVQLGKLTRVPHALDGALAPAQLAAQLTHDLLRGWGASAAALTAAGRGLEPRPGSPP
jgi:AcrR family transcriptional regulator